MVEKNEMLSYKYLFAFIVQIPPLSIKIRLLGFNSNLIDSSVMIILCVCVTGGVSYLLCQSSVYKGRYLFGREIYRILLLQINSLYKICRQ